LPTFRPEKTGFEAQLVISVAQSGFARDPARPRRLLSNCVNGSSVNRHISVGRVHVASSGIGTYYSWLLLVLMVLLAVLPSGAVGPAIGILVKLQQPRLIGVVGTRDLSRVRLLSEGGALTCALAADPGAGQPGRLR
jgi:hypothetical protein